jgi:starvation-inducible outer membrane lipoprotein
MTEGGAWHACTLNTMGACGCASVPPSVRSSDVAMMQAIDNARAITAPTTCANTRMTRTTHHGPLKLCGCASYGALVH